MNKPIAVAAVVLVCLLAGETGRAAYTSGYSNPVGSGVMPPSSYRPGLVRSPNPVDTSGNLLITGNVRGGRQFQGHVPYNSSTAFYDSLGTTSLDSFLRSSAGSENFGAYRGGTGYRYNEFYSQTGTVTGQRVLPPGAYDPASNRIITRPPNAFGLEQLDKSPTALDTTYDSRATTSLGPLARSNGELERMISHETATTPSNIRGLTPEQYEMEISMLRSDLERLRAKMETVNRDKTGKSQQGDGLLRDDYLPGERIEPLDDTASAYDRNSLEGTTSPTLSQPGRQNEEGSPYGLDQTPGLAGEDESIESLMQRIDNLLQRQNAAKAAVQEEAGEPKDKSVAEDANRKISEYMNKPNSYLEDGMTRSMTIRDKRRETNPEVVEPPREPISTIKEIESMSSEELSNEARRLMGAYGSLESYSGDKSRHYMKLADQYMAQGRFYRAADSYRLATVYKPGNPLADAGKSHALFAAGEYMSSILYLSRTLAKFPDYARHKVDFNALIGAETVQERIADIKSRLELIDVAELHFMLGYAYYRMGDLKAARGALDTAAKAMPGDKAVALISKAVDDAMKGK